MGPGTFQGVTLPRLWATVRAVDTLGRLRRQVVQAAGLGCALQQPGPQCRPRPRPRPREHVTSPAPAPPPAPGHHKSACSAAPAVVKFPAPAVPVPDTRESRPTRSEKGSDGRVGPQGSPGQRCGQKPSASICDPDTWDPNTRDYLRRFRRNPPLTYAIP
ncbi:hypothetical protein J1605_002309 [Eschrichtius robustus]|uniref:Uncharacterized protein n=1 Tax=Eschrichtius robustus TaxID=9764 RepID=A0AB34HWV5_ESCRO|nr:hypothetical protein J1605_002309 [Eschrichtius robustus]